jgi:LDH2 family malate/lactate/ureidoglycolate dehydrogenase
MQIDAFCEVDDFKRQIDDWIRTFRATRPIPGTSGPMIPGDPERAAEAERRVSGIPLVGPVVDDLRRIAAETGIPFD